MSGGSFEYVCFKLEDETEIFNALPQLEEMVTYLHTYGKHEAADEIHRAKLQLETLQHRALVVGKYIQDLAYACEWWASGDWGEDDFDAKWKEHLEGKHD